jgi:hypothetical protein
VVVETIIVEAIVHIPIAATVGEREPDKHILSAATVGWVYKVDVWVYNVDGWVYKVDGWVYKVDGWVYKVDG